MIRFEQVSYWYPESAEPALDNVTFELMEGVLALLVGPSGSGKSTLLRCINGLVPHFSGGVIQGSIRVNGVDPIEATPEQMSRHVGFVFQDPEAQFVMDRVEDEIAFALENAALSRQEMRVRVEEVLDLLDLAALRERRVETLSGGEKQRVAIASALALRPRVLVLDEPTSQLDPKSAEDVLHALTRLNADLGLTVVLAEHRLERVVHFSDKMLYLSGNGGVLTGDPRELLPHTSLLPPLVVLGEQLGWQPLPLTIKEGRRFSRDVSMPERRSANPSINRSSNHESEPIQSPYIAAHNVRVRYGDNEVLRGVNLSLYRGEVVALLGRNGAGKSTLLKSLVGLVRPQAGTIRVGEMNAADHDVAALCQRIGYLPQNPNALLFAETVSEEVEITLRNHGLLPRRAETPLPLEPEQLLERLGLSAKASAYPRDLSAGERQRVALASILVTKPQALLLDEPTRGLDYGAKQELLHLLRTWRGEGMAILLVTHDVELAAAAADRVLIMSQGEIIASGAPSDILGSSPLFAPQIARLFPDTGWLTASDAITGLADL